MHGAHRLAVVAAAIAAATAPLLAATLYTDPFGGGGGDLISRGFYFSNFPSSSLGTVTLGYSANTAGSYTIQLTATLDAYNGTVLGVQTVTANIATSTTSVTFNFNNVAVPTGHTVAFSQQQISGSGALFFDVGTSGPTGVTETDGTTPPLDAFRRAQVGVTITGGGTPTAAAPVLSTPAFIGLGLLLACAGWIVLKRAPVGHPPAS